HYGHDGDHIVREMEEEEEIEREVMEAWIYDHFEDIVGILYDEFKEELPRAAKYELTKGQTNQWAMRKMMDRLLPHDII
ncbi:hypothetical protein A2U01_0042643, partial [Trifolium medium]|nr:hypothetical protein [Trifolium medium]